MSLIGQRTPRRQRSTRLSSIGASHGPLARLIAALRNRSVVARLLLCLLAIIVMTVVVEGWKSPFRFRTGDRPPHGVLATVDFSHINHRETERRREQSAARVPLHFRHHPLLLDSLTDQLRADLQAVADAETLDMLHRDLHQAFGLTPDSPADTDGSEKPLSPAERFQTLRNLVLAVDATGSGAPSGDARIDRIETLLAEFLQLLRIIDRPGVIDPADVVRENLRAGVQLAITSEESQAETVAGLGDVQLDLMLKPGGRVASVWEVLPVLARIRQPVESWLQQNVEPTLSYDRVMTQGARKAARDRVEVDYESWFKGQVLVGPGEVIDEETLGLLRDEHKAGEAKVSLTLRLVRMGTVLLMMVILAVINGYYLVHNERRLVRSSGSLAVYLATLILAVALGRWAATPLLKAEVVPVLMTAMIFAVAWNQVMAALSALTISLILSLSTAGDLSQFVLLMSVSSTAVILLTHVPSRSTLIRVGFTTAVSCLIVYLGLGVLRSQALDSLWTDGHLLTEGLQSAAWCLGAGFLVAGSLPFVERAFGVVTDISLLEMSDISHPLLQELVRRAPGTYNHSITVASIAESAAEAIGANGLLVRVGAYFHDIGKMLKPEYFIENIGEGQKSRHELLAPAMSTLVIIGHVKDGVDLALQHHLPEQIIDFIEQHHGTTLVQYFFHEARKQADADHRTDAEESMFRYPGPKPQSREAGVMMLADAVESASRTLSEPTPRRIESLVHKITLDRLLDGQFEESSLTLSEIRLVEESLTQSLIAIYHGRIKYPEQQRVG